MEIIQALHQEDGEGRTKFPSQQNGRPVHSRSRTWNATRLGETECVMYRATEKLFVSPMCRSDSHTKDIAHVTLDEKKYNSTVQQIAHYVEREEYLRSALHRT